MNYRRTMILLLVAEATLGGMAIIYYGLTVETLQAVTRYSGRLSLLVFSIIFLFHNDERINSSLLLSEKYYLIFAIGHGIHLMELLSFVYFSGAILVPIRLAGGFLAYAFIFIMPWLAHQKQNNKLSTIKFMRLEYFFLFYVWIIFFMTYLPRVQGKLPQAGGTYAEHVAGLGWVCMLLGVKSQRLIMRRFRKDR